MKKILLLSAALFFFSCGGNVYKVYDLKVNGITAANGLEDSPVFSWKLQSSESGAKQKSFRIEVKDSAGETVWTSGTVENSRPFGVRYTGPDLPSNSFFRWKLTSFDNHGHKSRGEGTFSTGLRKEDWTARWIEMTAERKPFIRPDREQIVAEIMEMAGIVPGSAPFDPEESLDPPIFFRKEFHAEKRVHKAVVYVTAHGVYNLYVNGTKVSDPLSPGFTTYPHFLEYQQYDVTSLLDKGNNVLGAVVADGWWTGKLSIHAIGNQFGDRNALLCQLMIEYEDGSHEILGTDSSFKWTNDGPFRYSDLTEGEMYDAGKELSGWAEKGYDDSAWFPCKEADYGYDNLKGRMADPVRVVREVKAKRILHTPSGDTLIDFGENLAGRVKARLRGHSGDTVTFVHQEVLDKDGNLFYTMKSRCRNQRTRFVFGKNAQACFTPQFCWQGFRYVKVSGIDEVRAEDFTAEVLSSGLEPAGAFSCSDTLLSRLQENIVRSQVSNMISIPTDCPQREKAGWTGDMQIFAPTAAYNRDVKAFLERWLVNMRIDQSPEGAVPDVTPAIPYFNQTSANGCAGWGDAAIVVPWVLYQEYGDIKVLEENYDMMEKWHRFVEVETTDYLWNKDRYQYGEWLVPTVPEEYQKLGEGRVSYNVGQDEISTAMYFRSTLLLSKVARILGKEERADELEDLSEKIRRAFCEAYIHDDGTMQIDMQGQYVLALGLGIVSEPELKTRMQDHLAELVRENGNRLNTGFIPTPFLMDVLADIDPSLAMDVLFQTESPSWLYEVTKGATTLWEGWTQIASDGTPSSGSYNHFAYGCVGDYIYRRILGIAPAETAYGKVRIEPVFPRQLDWAEGWHETPYGRVSLSWEREPDGISLDITLPPGCGADVIAGNDYHQISSGSHRIKIPSYFPSETNTMPF